VGSAITSLTGNRPYRKSLLRVFNLEFEQAPLKQRQALLGSNLPRDRWRRSHPRRWSGKAGFDSRPCPVPRSCRLVGLSPLVGLGWGRSVCAAGRPPVGLPFHASKNPGGLGGGAPSLAVAPDFAPVLGQSCRFTGYHRLSQQVPVLSTTYEPSVLSACSSTTCKWESVSACSFNNLQA
jgi:hypothetical protein